MTVSPLEALFGGTHIFQNEGGLQHYDSLFKKNPNNNIQEELNPLELAYTLLSRFLRVSLTQTKLQAV